MDIGSGQGYPAAALSNFAPHPFVIDGVECNSMEGFLQSLKCPYPAVQIEICKLVGKAAKFRGKKYKWFRTGKLYWKGVEIDRFGDDYQRLLDRAYTELAKNTGFRAALLATQNAVLTHSIGKSKQSDTILTTSEFCGRLMRLREMMRK